MKAVLLKKRGICALLILFDFAELNSLCEIVGYIGMHVDSKAQHNISWS